MPKSKKTKVDPEVQYVAPKGPHENLADTVTEIPSGDLSIVMLNFWVDPTRSEYTARERSQIQSFLFTKLKNAGGAEIRSIPSLQMGTGFCTWYNTLVTNESALALFEVVKTHNKSHGKWFRVTAGLLPKLEIA